MMNREEVEGVSADFKRIVARMNILYEGGC